MFFLLKNQTEDDSRKFQSLKSFTHFELQVFSLIYVCNFCYSFMFPFNLNRELYSGQCKQILEKKRLFQKCYDFIKFCLDSYKFHFYINNNIIFINLSKYLI